MILGLPFVFLDVNDVSVARKRGVSTTWEDVKEGRWPPPEKHGGRSLWRSDVVAKALQEASADGVAQREAQFETSTEKAQRLAAASIASPNRKRGRGKGRKREIEALWKPPPDSEKDTTDSGPPSRSATAGENGKHSKRKPASGATQRGRP